MTILTQQSPVKNTSFNFIPQLDLSSLVDNLINNFAYNPKNDNYAKLMEYSSKDFRNSVIQYLKETFTSIDEQFRNSSDRKRHYYIKQTRKRTIITLYGELTYTRTEYIDRYTKKSYCYLDEKFGIRKRERFDSCVQNLIISCYADHNSMIKVGKIVGDRISGTFNTKQWQDITISRQTVYNILHRFKSLDVSLKQTINTPEIIYIMADEKYIPLQREKKKKAKQMVKVGVIFEGLESIKRKDSTLTKRNRLINKHVVISCVKPFWQEINDKLHQIYDMDKVKKIILMGDGASWIMSGRSELDFSYKNIEFAVDTFHFKQAINNLTSNKDLRKYLNDYVSHNDSDSFNQLTNSIIGQEPERELTIKQNHSYILKHWQHHQTMINDIKIGCPMEQAISHVIASSFTSVPKAYSRKNLPTYLSFRALKENHQNIRNILTEAMAAEPLKLQDVIVNPPEYDFSIFDRRQYNTKIDFINKDVLTLF